MQVFVLSVSAHSVSPGTHAVGTQPCPFRHASPGPQAVGWPLMQSAAHSSAFSTSAQPSSSPGAQMQPLELDPVVLLLLLLVLAVDVPVELVIAPVGSPPLSSLVELVELVGLVVDWLPAVVLVGGAPLVSTLPVVVVVVTALPVLAPVLAVSLPVSPAPPHATTRPSPIHPM